MPTPPRCARRPAAWMSVSDTPGMKKSIARPVMCWLNLATPLERRRSMELVSSER